MEPNRLREILHYSPATGDFTWIAPPPRSKIKAGAIAGSSDARGYRSIKINGRSYLAHRLAWLYVHGRFPVAEIDHRDGDPKNNKISNLREATRAQNRHNTRVHCNNKTGVKGVRPSGPKWRATIYVDGNLKNLGSYASLELAQAAYIRAAIKHRGEFARW